MTPLLPWQYLKISGIPHGDYDAHVLQFGSTWSIIHSHKYSKIHDIVIGDKAPAKLNGYKVTTMKLSHAEDARLPRQPQKRNGCGPLMFENDLYAMISGFGSYPHPKVNVCHRMDIYCTKYASLRSPDGPGRRRRCSKSFK